MMSVIADALHPMAMGVATTVFLLYAATSLLLVYGIKKNISALVRLFLASTCATIAFCLTGHLIIFTFFEWHDVKQLVVVIVVNLTWYIWWTYSFLVVLSHYVHKRESEVLEAGGGCVTKASLYAVDLPQPPRDEEYLRHSHISSDEVTL